MISTNPKREFTLQVNVNAVITAIFSIVQKEPSKYTLVNDDTVLSMIRIHEKGILMDVGYHIDFIYKKKTETETDVVIEVSRKIGAIDSPTEIHNANYILKEITDKFSAYLSGKVNAETGKAEIPKNDGCIGVFTLLVIIILSIILT